MDRDRNEVAREFYIDDHAVLLAVIARAADDCCGDAGLDAVVKAIVAYGRERGLRAAMRCLADGEPLSGKNYILYGEWADPKGWSKSEVVATQPYYRTDMTFCGWCDVWKQHDLLNYGRLYCDWVDANLVYGFNPELVLDMGSVMSHDDTPCEFHWKSCTFKDDSEAEAMASQRAELIPRVTKDFLYHCGHLLSTFRREIYTELGLPKGHKIIEKALTDYSETFNTKKREAILAESRLNFMEA